MTNVPVSNLSRLLGEPWLMIDSHVDLFLSRLQQDVPASFFQDEDPRQEEDPRPYHVDEDGTAHLEFHGVVGKRLERWEVYWLGMLDQDTFNSQLNIAAQDDTVQRIRIDFDSPGGSALGVLETMANVRRVQAIKPITAVTEMIMGSAAYFVASQATTILATESAIVGSIGTMAQVLDRSKMFQEMGLKMDVITNKEGTYKGAGTPGTSLTKAQREQIEERIQYLHDHSTAMITAARPQLQAEAMRGQVMHGVQAYWQGTGLIDDLLKPAE